MEAFVVFGGCVGVLAMVVWLVNAETPHFVSHVYCCEHRHKEVGYGRTRKTAEQDGKEKHYKSGCTCKRFISRTREMRRRSNETRT